MGLKEMGFFLLLFCFLLLPASSSPLHQTLFSGFWQKKDVGNEGMNEMSTTGPDGQISTVNKRGVGGGRGSSRGGADAGAGAGKGNGGTTTPDTTGTGTSTFIPIYAGTGAVNSHHNHYRSAACSNGGYGMTTLGTAISAILVLRLY